MKVMKALYYISVILIFIGTCSIPGCIEFDEGWIQTICMILIGAAGVTIIKKVFHYEA